MPLKHLQGLYASVVIIAVLVPNLYAVVQGNENFPFSSCPMFAHYIGEETQLYNFKFVGTYNNVEKILPPSFGNDGEVMSMRFFFAKVYGSSLKKSPFTVTADDDRILFEKRLSDYFRAYLKAFPDPAFSSGLKNIRLEIWHLGTEGEVHDKHTVGYYDVSAEKFHHTWEKD